MTFRTEHTPEWRAGEVRHTLDPGFVHFRKIETILGPKGMEVVDDQIRRLPELPDWQRRVRIEHIFAKTMLMWCELNQVPPLGEVVAKRRGQLFCSTHELGPCPEVATESRVVSEILLEDSSQPRMELHYSTEHIFGTTPRERLRDGATFSIIAQLGSVSDKCVIFEPIVMGSPWLEGDESGPYVSIEWYASEFYEHFVEDIDEFSRVRSEPEPESVEPMKDLSEMAVKTCFAELLGDTAGKDWGGESSDHYTSHLRLAGKRETAAFLFKGPARFEPMGLNHLGKNNDQIVRLADEPANLLIVQHCHDILPAVRKTLRAFAVQPSRPRRYCLIDGRDTLRLLRAYGLYEKALALTRAAKIERR